MQNEGRFKQLSVLKSDSYAQVNMKICGTYKISNLKYKFLECIKGGNKLVISSNQALNGSEVILRRRCLYLCKEVCMYIHWCDKILVNL